MRIRVISYGLGPIGLSIAKLAKRDSQLEIVGAVDMDPRLAGKDLGSLLGEDDIGVRVEKNGRGMYSDADVVLHATTSYLSSAKNQFIEFCENKVDVVSTCEELAYPWFRHAGIAKKIDAAARGNGVTLLGTGVNPGFVMDALAITLSGACERVTEVRATRILDATKRRLPFQRKVGIGLSLKDFQKNVRTGKFGHIGLPESIALTCAAMGIKVTKVEQRISPKIAASKIKTRNFGTVPKGSVIGIVQDGRAFARGRRVANYHIEMYAGARKTFDEIELVGVPRISLRVLGGTPGDIATAAIVVNSIRRVIESSPGLKTVKDLRPATSSML
jgi:2,4-diaminopentanoate dehydrogenase